MIHLVISIGYRPSLSISHELTLPYCQHAALFTVWHQARRNRSRAAPAYKATLITHTAERLPLGFTAHMHT